MRFSAALLLEDGCQLNSQLYERARFYKALAPHTRTGGMYSAQAP